MLFDKLINIGAPEPLAGAEMHAWNTGFATIHVIVDPLIGYAEQAGNFTDGKKAIGH